jgi:diguanylate cyclase (GGDEF)-like protein
MTQPEGLVGFEDEKGPVPARALVLSLLALSAPVVGALMAPEWMEQESGILLWLTVFIPPFLLTYYRGWRGASLALAGGMATLSLVPAALFLFGFQPPAFGTLLWMVSTYVGVCVGVAVFSEVLRRKLRTVEAMALTDVLTQLPNRRHAGIFLSAAFGSASRGEAASVVLMDLDHFKRVNDTYGHRTGDEVLRRFGAALARATRRMDLSARWGGEEFLAVLQKCDAEGARIFTERVQGEFAQEQFPWGSVTFSTGIAQYHAGMGTPELWVAEADRALYQAKESGRNAVRVAEVVPLEQVFDLQAEIREIEERRRRAQQEALGPVGGEAGAEGGTGALPGGTESLLLVEDDAPTRQTLARLLRGLGYQVVEAPDGPSALATLRELERVDLVLTDLVMPGMSGFGLAERIEAEHGPHRILYVSGRLQGELAWAGAPGTRFAYLSKPFAPTDVAGAVRALLDESLEEGLPVGP